MKNGLIRKRRIIHGSRITGRASPAAQTVPATPIPMSKLTDQCPRIGYVKAPARQGTIAYGNVTALPASKREIRNGNRPWRNLWSRKNQTWAHVRRESKARKSD